jgi:hypothetical protein
VTADAPAAPEKVRSGSQIVLLTLAAGLGRCGPLIHDHPVEHKASECLTSVFGCAGHMHR